jgi:hypothetical protein
MDDRKASRAHQKNDWTSCEREAGKYLVVPEREPGRFNAFGVHQAEAKIAEMIVIGRRDRQFETIHFDRAFQCATRATLVSFIRGNAVSRAGMIPRFSRRAMNDRIHTSWSGLRHAVTIFPSVMASPGE